MKYVVSCVDQPPESAIRHIAQIRDQHETEHQKYELQSMTTDSRFKGKV
jgi:hypothetical protein